MRLPRRRFLANSSTVLGASLVEALATPLWRWKNAAILETAAIPQKSPVQFIDVAREAGLNSPNVWGDPDHKRYIIEAKGSGLAFFDYDHDGWLEAAAGQRKFFEQFGDHLPREIREENEALTKRLQG